MILANIGALITVALGGLGFCRVKPFSLLPSPPFLETPGRLMAFRGFSLHAREGG
jgi:hypothetical protein